MTEADTESEVGNRGGRGRLVAVVLLFVLVAVAAIVAALTRGTPKPQATTQAATAPLTQPATAPATQTANKASTKPRGPTTQYIDAVFAKSGSVGTLYRYDPPAEATSDTWLAGPLNRYRSSLEPMKIAELMMLRRDVPRSVHHCLWMVDLSMRELADTYGTHGEADRLAGELHARLRYARIDKIYDIGLRPFLGGVRADIATLSDQIGRQFLLD